MACPVIPGARSSGSRRQGRETADRAPTRIQRVLGVAVGDPDTTRADCVICNRGTHGAYGSVGIRGRRNERAGHGYTNSGQFEAI